MNTTILDAFVEDLRSKRIDPRDVPGFDPTNENINAKVLLVLEASGPGAVTSKRVSIENEDPTARNLKKLLVKAALKPGDLMIWNVVQWYCGNDEKTKPWGQVVSYVRCPDGTLWKFALQWVAKLRPNFNVTADTPTKPASPW
jgi:hypothetical protein